MIRKKGGKSTPEISTASLPDIIFMLLFFFMVVTVMRETEQKVEVQYPKATELAKLEKKSVVSTIYVGPPNNNYKKTFGTAPRIQLNDEIADKEEIFQWVQDERNKLNEKKQPAFTVSIKADSKTKMGIISELKQELRKAAALKVNYSAVLRND